MFLVFVFLFGVGFVSVCLFCFVLFCGWMVLFLFFFWGGGVLFFGGFKGQVRWPKGPPHLALNPPYFFVFVF